MTPGPGIEPGTHWWKASTLTTTPTLLPLNEYNENEYKFTEMLIVMLCAATLDVKK